MRDLATDLVDEGKRGSIEPQGPRLSPVSDEADEGLAPAVHLTTPVPAAAGSVSRPNRIHGEVAQRRFEEEPCSPREVLRSCLLLLLEECSAHGYVLLRRLEPLGFERSNPARIYRALRCLHGAGLVQASSEISTVGPARRVYELSPSGRRALTASLGTLRRQAKSIDDRPARYILSRLKVLSNNKKGFEFIVEVQLSVQAIDETSARRKLERAFAQMHVFDDVSTASRGSDLPARRWATRVGPVHLRNVDLDRPQRTCNADAAGTGAVDVDAGDISERR